MEPDRLFDCLPSTLRPSSESQPEAGRNTSAENQEAAVYSPPALIEPKFVPLLTKLAQQLVQAGCQQQCSEIYRYKQLYREFSPFFKFKKKVSCLR
jgi:exocyst complex component 7